MINSGRFMFQRLLAIILRFLISLRYRLVFEGWEDLEKGLKKRSGIIFLPNHSAEIDPPILMAILWPKFHPHPVVVDDFYYQKGLYFLMRYIGALPCPNMEYAVNRWKVRQLEKLQDRVVDGIRNGENYLIYPSGKLRTAEKEIVGGASFIPNVLQKESKTSVVLVRVTGLWGSRFSRALTGEVPDFGKNLLASLWVILKNGLFFTPRRTVQIEFLVDPTNFPHQGERTAVNRYLEDWYNAVPDPLKRVSYSFWKEELPSITDGERKVAVAIQVPKSLEREVTRQIAEIASLPPAQVTADKQLIRDLGIDSLDIAQILLFLDEKYQVGPLTLDFSSTVGDLLQAAAKPGAQEETDRMPPGALHAQEKNRPPPLPPQGRTIMEAFLRTCDRMPGAIACTDATAGVLTYRKFKTAVLLLAEEIRKMPGETIGIMLPSSAGAYIVILATLFAGKVPVMLNWTVGPKSVSHAIATTGLKVILSSLRFLNRLRNLEIGEDAQEMMILLEDVRRAITLPKKLRALHRSFRGADTILKRLSLSTADPSSPAVILFTSGTETLPKGVPLSHRNLLSNQGAAMESAGLKNSDYMYGVLPPFHSFGFSVTGLLPLVTGLKVFYAPDPTNHRGMVRDIATYKPTLFCCAPTFIRSLFYAAAPEQLQSLQIIVTGAEKAGQELFDYVKLNLPGSQIWEGYGITECSPIVTLCRPYKSNEERREGVGHPLPGVELLIVNPETREPLQRGKEGEVCISGPGVFAGYLGTSKNPFIEKEGKKWYCSGDMGYLTADGALVLSGRLKRFVKIGGEMISLGGLEEEIAQVIKNEEGEGPNFALCSVEKEGHKTVLVLYTINPVDKESVNSFLKTRGHSNLARISEVRTIPQIPLTGTGKTNYRLLEEISGRS